MTMLNELALSLVLLAENPLDDCQEALNAAQVERTRLLEENARLRAELDDCLGVERELPVVLWADPFDPAVNRRDLPVRKIDIAYQHVLDRDFISRYQMDGVRDPDNPNRVIAVVFKDCDVTLDRGKHYELGIKSPNMYRQVASPPGFYPKGTPIEIDRPIWDPDRRIRNKRAFIYDGLLDREKFDAWLEERPDRQYIGLNHEQCVALWNSEMPNHETLMNTFIEEVEVARAAGDRERIVTHYVPPRASSCDWFADATDEEKTARHILYSEYFQPIYQAEDIIGNDMYAHVLWHTPADEQKSKEWMAWALDTWLKAAELAGGKQVAVWLMDRVEFNADNDANALVPFDELVARIKFILDYRRGEDYVDVLLVWNSSDDVRFVNAIREACGLEHIPTVNP